ncbi:Vegetative incompatibility protein HET-E-1 [Fusarium oxysporum]|nr:Vegetative incompatibility protein HET-E-1 [Fusarium oxysporum]
MPAKLESTLRLLLTPPYLLTAFPTMVSLTERLKVKLGRKAPPKPPNDQARPASIPSKSQPPARPDSTKSPTSLPERLWNQAYEQVKAGNLSTVSVYEKILSARLREQDASVSELPDLAGLESRQNEIAQIADERRGQMQRLVQHGLRRTERDAEVKQGMEDGIRAAMAIKEVVDKAVQASPEAAIAWVGIMMNPLTQASSNRQGIAYVLSRMDWYWNLSRLLLDENITEAHSQGLRGELEKVITDLYSKLLLFQMKSVCYYHRGRLSGFARDLIKLDNWDGELSAIQAAEAAVQTDSAQYNTLSIRNRLGEIAETAKSQNVKLDSISSAIREQTRQQERIHETSADNTCLADLRLTDPRDDRKRIEETKGGLLKDSYRWILENTDFQRWRNDPQNPLLWVKADPGKGKTMLLCGVIDELQQSMGATDLLSYFFCQASDSRINNANAALRGLMYVLVCQQPSLISHVRKKYDHAGKALFEDANAWIALSDMFKAMVQDPKMKNTVLVVDALDECIAGLPNLLDLVISTSSSSTLIKWLLSSRNEPHIEQKLRSIDAQGTLSLELKENAEQVSHAVNIYIDTKLSHLESLEDDCLMDQVRDALRQKANGTFLWVALVVRELEKAECWDPLQVVQEAPEDLHQFYDRMMTQIQNLAPRNSEMCRHTLAITTVAYRPLSLTELGSLCALTTRQGSALAKISRKLVAMCGSFLTVRDDQVYLVHQSAKDYLSSKMGGTVFPSQSEIHHTLYARSLELMSGTLKRDIYGLIEPGFLIEHFQAPVHDPLAPVHYSCAYWVDHLYDSVLGKSSTVDGSVQTLLQEGNLNDFLSKKFLYWLEALSLCKIMSKGIVSMAKLEDLIHGREDASSLLELARDARRFILSHNVAIEKAPLQAYVSALVFSPTSSLTRQNFNHDVPCWLTINPPMEDRWGACLQTLEGHRNYVNSVAFSHDSTRLASASNDNTIMIWDASSGTNFQTIEGHTSSISSVAFSHHSTQLASASDDKTIKIWDASSGVCLKTLEGHGGCVTSAIFSYDSNRLVSASDDRTARIWDASSGACLQILKGHDDFIYSVAFTHDSTQLATASRDRTVKIWDANSGECLQTLKGHTSQVNSVAFSHESILLASASDDRTVRIWDASSGACLQTLEGHGGYVKSVVFSSDSTRLATASDDNTAKVWGASSGACLQTLEGHSKYVRSVAFSYDSTRLASTSKDHTVKIWDVSSNSGGAFSQIPKGHGDLVNSVAFSHDSTCLASASDDCTVKIWDVSSGACLQTLEGHSSYVRSVAFSCDSTRLASTSRDKTVKIWDVSSGACLQTLEGHSICTNSVAFSHDSIWLASSSDDWTVKIWDVSSGTCLKTLEEHKSCTRAVAFSHNSIRLASASEDKTVKIWDVSSGTCLKTLDVLKPLFNISFNATDSCLHTEIGVITIGAPSISDGKIAVTESQHSQHQSVTLSSDKAWLTFNSRKLVWLPSEFRPSSIAMSGRTVGIGGGSGKVWFCHIEPSKL